MLGGELALEVCRKHAGDGDVGEMHSALRVFCRRDRKDDAFAVLSALDPSAKDSVRAASQALTLRCPSRMAE